MDHLIPGEFPESVKINETVTFGDENMDDGIDFDDLEKKSKTRKVTIKEGGLEEYNNEYLMKSHSPLVLKVRQNNKE